MEIYKSEINSIEDSDFHIHSRNHRFSYNYDLSDNLLPEKSEKNIMDRFTKFIDRDTGINVKEICGNEICEEIKKTQSFYSKQLLESNILPCLYSKFNMQINETIVTLISKIFCNLSVVSNQYRKYFFYILPEKANINTFPDSVFDCINSDITSLNVPESHLYMLTCLVNCFLDPELTPEILKYSDKILKLCEKYIVPYLAVINSSNESLLVTQDPLVIQIFRLLVTWYQTDFSDSLNVTYQSKIYQVGIEILKSPLILAKEEFKKYVSIIIYYFLVTRIITLDQFFKMNLFSFLKRHIYEEPEYLLNSLAFISQHLPKGEENIFSLEPCFNLLINPNSSNHIRALSCCTITNWVLSGHSLDLDPTKIDMDDLIKKIVFLLDESPLKLKRHFTIFLCMLFNQNPAFIDKYCNYIDLNTLINKMGSLIDGLSKDKGEISLYFNTFILIKRYADIQGMKLDSNVIQESQLIETFLECIENETLPYEKKSILIAEFKNQISEL